jgi:hypothetical protein
MLVAEFRHSDLSFPSFRPQGEILSGTSGSERFLVAGLPEMAERSTLLTKRTLRCSSEDGCLQRREVIKHIDIPAYFLLKGLVLIQVTRRRQ